MKNIIKYKYNSCRLRIDSNIAISDKQFLANFYQIDNKYSLCLTKKNNIYNLIDEDNNMTLDIDFLSGNYQYRNSKIGKESLLKAIKINNKIPNSLVDTTPGLLKDSFMLDSRGIKITAIERNPLIYIIIRRSLSQTDTSINYIFGNSIDKLGKISSDVIYLDPMFPEKKKSAKTKKDMQILQNIVGADNDSNILLSVALQSNATRVIVKRPSNAKPLSHIKPNFIYSLNKKKAIRYDIYLISNYDKIKL